MFCYHFLITQSVKSDTICSLIKILKMYYKDDLSKQILHFMVRYLSELLPPIFIHSNA